MLFVFTVEVMIHLVSKGMENILQGTCNASLPSTQDNTGKCLVTDSKPRSKFSLSPSTQSFLYDDYAFQDDHRAFRRQLEDKRPVVESNLLSGRQYIANEPPLSDTSDSEGRTRFSRLHHLLDICIHEKEVRS